ncbi:MAG TPA: hypothetical protein VGH40_13550 [Roseiarcus sp.]|jgi:hypothetical protein
MGPGGVTESLIAHFAGYLHITEDFVRNRILYDEGPLAPRPHPYAPDELLPPAPPPPVDIPDSQPYHITYTPSFDPLRHIKSHIPPPHHDALSHAPLPHDEAPPPPLVEAPVPVAEGAAYVEYSSSYSYIAPAPDQELIPAVQINAMQNNNVDLVLTDGPAPSNHSNADAAIVAHMFNDAESYLPSDLAPGTSDTTTIVNGVTAHDAALAANPAGASNVAPGVYDNGVLQPASATFNPTIPDLTNVFNPPPDASHNGMTNPGLDAVTGSNTSVNVASILDENTERSGLVVMGNAYSTNAIYQVNELTSDAHVQVDGAAAALDVVTGGNSVDNLASFANHPTSVSNFVSFSPTANVQVDEVNGNFYDVKGLLQTNYLSNNDVVVQTATSSFNQVDTGTDTQINSLPLNELNASYDLIIVQGSFYTANVVAQTNVLMNDATVMMGTTAGDTASETITTGGNTLTNAASIDTYGQTAYQPLSASLQAAVTAAENGQPNALLASLLPNNGSGTIHVLYITGNFYDVNYIGQTNVMLNSDAVAQYLPSTGSTTAPTGAPISSTESASTGSNTLFNLGQIASVGTITNFQYVGGQAYSDAILVQANLVSEHSHVAVGETPSLGNELAAYTGVETWATPQGDATHHQDLFHGVMS